jgi:hypothetical protein
MNEGPSEDGTPGASLERSVADVERLAERGDEDHEGRLGALERLHEELEAELEDRDPDVRPEP